MRPNPACHAHVAWSMCLLLVLTSGCRGERDRPPASSENGDPPTVDTNVSATGARHVVLVTIDTLRADHLGAYGGDIATPALDRIAAQGALVRHASAHVPLTRPSHVNLMTGRLPIETGIRENVTPVTIPEVPLLAEVFHAAGFETAGFVSSVVLTAASGLGRGFETYVDDFEADPQDPGFLDTAQKRGDLTLAEALAWLEPMAAAAAEKNTGSRAGEAGGRIFLWLHLYDPHDPYSPPEPWASQLIDRPYAGEVAWTDTLIAQLDAALTRFGLRDDSLLIVTSDHGEGLGEHGEDAHGFFVYESTLHIPMLLRGPGIAAGTQVEPVIGLVDLYPTMLELAGLDPTGFGSADKRAPGAERPIDGRSFAASLRSAAAGTPPTMPTADRTLYAESMVPKLHYGWSDLRVVRDGRFKYIDAPRPELYDLDADPREQVNLVNDQRRMLHALRDRLAAYRAAEEAATAARADRAPDANAAAAQASLRQELAALGYIGSTPTTRDPGADPKDKIASFRQANQLTREGLAAQHAGKHAAAVAAFEALLASGVESAESHLYLGRSQLALGRFVAAGEHFQHTLAQVPTYSGAWLGLAESLIQQGDLPAAERTLRQARAALPGIAAVAREQGRLLRRIKQPDGARQAFEASLAIDPEDAESHALLGQVMRDQGDLAAASRHLRRAVELAPGQASFWNVLGMTLANAGGLVEAEGAFREALRLDQLDPQHAYNLGLALVYLQRTEEALVFLRQAAELGFAPAREQLRKIGS